MNIQQQAEEQGRPMQGALATRCRICHRGLKSLDSRERGMGRVCASKNAHPGDTGDDMQQLLNDVDRFSASGELVCRQIQLEDGVEYLTNIEQRFKHHSPTGFAWGYLGSGPADLALNVLAQLYPVEGDGYEGTQIYDRQYVSATAWILHQDFKDEFIARIPKSGGRLPAALVRAWVEGKKATSSVQERYAQYFTLEEKKLYGGSA